MKKILFSLLGVSILVAVLVFVLPSWRRTEVQQVRSPRPVRMMTLSHFNGRRTRIFPGEVRPADQVDLAFRVSGILQEVLVSRGDEMKKGELVAVLDKRDFETSLAQAQSALQSAQSQLSAMKTGARQEEVLALSAQVNAARAKFNEARVTLGRYANLLNAGAVSRAEYDRIKAVHDVAREDLKVTEQMLDIGKAGSRLEDIQAQEANIRGLISRVRVAEDALLDTELRAPFDGILAEKYVDNFQTVQLKQPIAALQNIRELDVAVAIPGNMVLNLDPHTALSVRGEFLYSTQARFPTLPDRLFNLRFKEVSTVGNVQSQTYRVTLFMEKPNDLLVLPGMGMDVLFTERRNDTASPNFSVPLSAIAAGENNAHYVWKVSDKEGRMSVLRTPVTVEGYMGEQCLVSGDLSEGDRIVAAGLAYLQEGDEVRVYSFPRYEDGKGQ